MGIAANPVIGSGAVWSPVPLAASQAASSSSRSVDDGRRSAADRTPDVAAGAAAVGRPTMVTSTPGIRSGSSALRAVVVPVGLVSSRPMPIRATPVSAVSTSTLDSDAITVTCRGRVTASAARSSAEAAGPTGSSGIS